MGVDVVVGKIDGFLAQYPSRTQFEKFKQLEEKTGYSKVYFFLAAVLSISMFIIVAGGLKLVTDLVGFLYPAYMSFKAIENASTDATQWLTYWGLLGHRTHRGRLPLHHRAHPLLLPDEGRHHRLVVPPQDAGSRGRLQPDPSPVPPPVPRDDENEEGRGEGRLISFIHRCFYISATKT